VSGAAGASDAVPTHVVRLALVRHGEAEGNRALAYLGNTDAPLTERGRVQADDLARSLARFRLDAVYTSPLMRAADTAAAIARAAGLVAVVEPALHESAYGAWEGLTRAKVLARDPETLRRWEADPDVAPPGGGESLRATQQRVVACVDALVERHRGHTVVLVSHVGPVKALVCHAVGLGPEGARRMWLDSASITVLDWPVDPRRTGVLRLYNACDHLSDGARWLPLR
jgi:ribonuclease H / adenosylcobalamin/alpha-ribazole phosphatase